MGIPSVESLRVPEEGSSAQGQSGPKPRPKGVGDGKQVDIPVPPRFHLSHGGTQEGRASAPLDVCVEADEAGRQANPSAVTLSGDREGNIVPKFPILHCQEKPLARKLVPVP